MHWSEMIAFDVSPWALMFRGSVMYWSLFVVFRFVLRRDVGGIGVADVLFVVLVADASQNAMTGGYTSPAEGLVLVATLVGWNVLFDWAGYRFKWAARLLEPPPLLLIRRGRVLRRNLRQEMLTLDDLKAHLRQHGLESVAEVKAAWLESDGDFSVIPLGKSASDTPPQKKPPA